MSCGNTNDVQLSMPGIVSARLTVISLVDSKIIFQKNINGSNVEVGVIETGIGFESIEIKIDQAKYKTVFNESTFESDEFFSTIISSDFTGDTLNINPLTTLASCRFKKTIDQDSKFLNNQINFENKLIMDQFLVADLLGILPTTDFSKVEVLNNESMLGILLGGFDQLAKDQNLAVSTLLRLLCDDISYDGLFNGIGVRGVIQENLAGYDEQLIKAKYAEAIYKFGQNNIKFFDKLPLDALANQISMSAIPQLFLPTIINYSFEGP